MIQIKDKEVKLGTGVIQGGVLSPTLFIIMFDDLIKDLVKNGFDTFAFADDLAVNGFLDKNLKKAIKIIEKWMNENKMKINRKKSGIIYHTKRNRQ